MLSAIIVILNLIILEGLSSVDNAAILAVMVSKLPKEKQHKALRYGIIGAYLMRGLCLFIASWLITMHWIKFIGGGYLVYLFITNSLTSNNSSSEYNRPMDIPFWMFVCFIEFIDLAFSIDNVFAAVAMSKNIYVIMIGVFIGILAMRFVATKFIDLIHKYPGLSKSAFIVIGLLGLRLMIEGGSHYVKHDNAKTILEVMDTHTFDIVYSVLMMCIFIIPMLKKSDKTDRHWFI